MIVKESNPPFSSVTRSSVGETIIMAATSAEEGKDKMPKLSPVMTTAEIIEEIKDLLHILLLMRKLVKLGNYAILERIYSGKDAPHELVVLW
jgi:hypothetical protein